MLVKAENIPARGSSFVIKYSAGDRCQALTVIVKQAIELRGEQWEGSSQHGTVALKMRAQETPKWLSCEVLPEWVRGGRASRVWFIRHTALAHNKGWEEAD